MAQPVFSRAYWVLAPDDDQVDSLAAIYGISFDGVTKSQIREAFSLYSRERATLTEGVPRSKMRKHLQRVATSSRTIASLLSGDSDIFDDWTAVEPPQGILPREPLAVEARHVLHQALMSMDGSILAEYKCDPKLRKIEPLNLALQLAQLARAADLAVVRLGVAKGGRPDGGSAALVEIMASVLIRAGVNVTCRFDAGQDKFRGSFVKAATWLKNVGVQEKHSTLCQYAAEYLRRRAAEEKKPARKSRVRS